MKSFYEYLLPARRVNMAAEMFDRSPTTGIIVFEVLAVILICLALLILSRIKKKIPLRFLIAVTGIFIFEMFTSPMWNNLHLGSWAYLYRDVSWILTFGWAGMILTAVTLVDHYFQKLGRPARFLLSLLFLSVLGLAGETLVVHLGIRTYSPEVKEAVWLYIPFLGIPLNAVFYIPVFMALATGFYDYWCLAVDNKPVMPMKKRKWGRDLIIATIGILLFEIMVEPMVKNAKLPAWSYIYRDLNFILTGIWIVIVWISLKFADKFFINTGLAYRFLIYVVTVGILALPFEAYFIRSGIRVYGPSATENMSGIVIPGINVPTELVFAIPLYFALVIAFIRYWEIILDNRRLK